MRYGILSFLLFLHSISYTTTYFVDSASGNDSNNGLDSTLAWQSLDKINAFSFQSGDRVLFRAGSSWQGQLIVSRKGAPSQPIVFETYGEGPKPRIDASGLHEDAILIRNAEYVDVRDFELINQGEDEKIRRGVHILAANIGTLHDISISSLYIHDVSGSLENKDSGGIIFRCLGDKTPSRFDGLRIERNIVWRVDRSGIAGQSYHWPRRRWFPSLNVVIRENWVGNAGSDGIVPWATDGVLVEHNIVQGASERSDKNNVGIWPWSADNSLFRLNRASEVNSLQDGQGFDSDYNSRNTVFEYNLSHDNEGGFMLICNPGDLDPRDNIGNIGTIVRYNISRNDRNRIFHVSAAENTRIMQNAIYVGKGLDVQMLLLSNWEGWTKGLLFEHNLFFIEGEARFGHEISRSKDGSYKIGPGWGPAKDVVFRGNRYQGNTQPQGSEQADLSSSAPEPIDIHADWPGPQLDLNQIETFPEYIKRHRAWMVELMQRQFGKNIE